MLTADWVMNSLSAAALKLPVSATMTNVFRCLKAMREHKKI
jgi:hypothetical protein